MGYLDMQKDAEVEAPKWNELRALAEATSVAALYEREREDRARLVQAAEGVSEGYDHPTGVRGAGRTRGPRRRYIRPAHAVGIRRTRRDI